jgi:hypothetical protein
MIEKYSIFQRCILLSPSPRQKLQNERNDKLICNYNFKIYSAGHRRAENVFKILSGV